MANSMRVFLISSFHGQALYYRDRDAEAISILEEVLHSLEVIGEEDLVILTLDLISRCQCAMGHKYEAESTLQEAIKRNEAWYGKLDSNTLLLKTNLEKWLREWGREAESAVLKAEIDEILGPDDIELEDINFEKF